MSGLVEDTPEAQGDSRKCVGHRRSRYGSAYFLERGRSGDGHRRAVEGSRGCGLLGCPPAGGVRRRRWRHGRGRRRRRGTGRARDADADLGDLAGDLRQHPRPPRLRGDEAAVAARPGRRIQEDGLRTDRARRRIEQPQRRHHRASYRGGGWTISGSKYYISAIDQADAVLLVPRTSTISTPEKSALSLFVVPTDSPGLTLQKIDTSIVSPDKQFTGFLDDVDVDDDA